MLNLVKGHRVSLVENLFESFTKLTEHHLMANVNAEKILEVFQHFIAIHDEPLFFIKGFSQLRRQSLRNKKPPAMRVRDKS